MGRLPGYADGQRLGDVWDLDLSLVIVPEFLGDDEPVGCQCVGDDPPVGSLQKFRDLMLLVFWILGDVICHNLILLLNVFVVRLALWVMMIGGLALWGYGRGLGRPYTRVIGGVVTVAGAMGLIWAYHETNRKKTWTMPVPTDPRLPVNCPSCGLPLKHLSTTREASGEIHIYRCPTHGRFRLDGDGLKPEPM